MGTNRANKTKGKRHSCSLCKPHKMRGGNRWKKKYKNKLDLVTKEIKEGKK